MIPEPCYNVVKRLEKQDIYYEIGEKIIMSRENTDKLLEMLEDGLLDKDAVLLACVKWMSEDDVREMMEANEIPIVGDDRAEY